MIKLLEAGRSLAEQIPYALVALVARVAIATVFWRSALTKIDTEAYQIREAAFFLFQHEYKVPLLPHHVATYIATAAELIFPVLLVIGLASRLSALALFGMTMVIQLFVYPHAWPTHLLWAGLLLLIIARGPGALSLDHLLWGWMHRDTAAAKPASAN